MSGAAGLRPELGCAGFPDGRSVAGSARGAAGCAPAGSFALLLARGLRSSSRWLHSARAPLAVRAAARTARRPPAPAARRGALTLGAAPASSPSGSCSSLGRWPQSVAALPGEPPGERQASGRIINHRGRPYQASARSVIRAQRAGLLLHNCWLCGSAGERG